MIVQYAKRIVNVIKKEGCEEFLVRMVRRILSVLAVLFIVLIWPFKKIRLIRMRSSRIGHFADNIHLSLCAMKYNTYPEEKNCIHLYSTQTYVPICNEFLYKMSSRSIKITPPWGAFWSHVDSLLIKILKKKYYTPFKKLFEDSTGGYDVWNFHKKGKNQFIFFSEEEKCVGNQLKCQLGIHADKPFVCLLVRDAAYVKNIMPDSAWHNENFRNADINNYIPAIQFLIEQGFYVVRMGKYVEKKIDIGNSRFIDYSTHSLKSDFMDIFLSGHCTFFITTSCGLDSVPRILNRPVITTNAIYFQEKCYVDWTFIVYKNIVCKKTNQLVPYHEIFKDYAHFTLSGKYTNHRDPIMQEWARKSWEFVDNTPDEILGVVKEMLAYLENSEVNTDEVKELQLLFWKNMPYELAFGEKSHEGITMLVSPYFLRKHISLLNNKISKSCEIEKSDLIDG